MLVQVQTLDRYKQKRLKTLAWVQEMDLYKHYGGYQTLSSILAAAS